jgi:hypothetical protein
MTDLLNQLLDATADFDPDDPTSHASIVETCRVLRKQAVDTLCYFERDFPASELSPFIHELLHVSEFVYRWNAVRNYWCFVTERFVGWMKGFVQNRFLSLQNMVQHFMRMPSTNQNVVPLNLSQYPRICLILHTIVTYTHISPS